MTQNSLGPLVRIEGNFNSGKYLEILNREVLDYAEAEFGYGDWYYYQDNSPIHKSQVVNEWFQHNLTPYQRIPAPPNSQILTQLSTHGHKQRLEYPMGEYMTLLLTFGSE